MKAISTYEYIVKDLLTTFLRRKAPAEIHLSMIASLYNKLID